MKYIYLSSGMLIFFIFGYFYTDVRNYKKQHPQFSKILDTLSKHSEICDFSAKIDCSYPYGTQFLGFVYNQCFGNELNKECYYNNKKKQTAFSLLSFERNFDYKYIPQEVIQASNLDEKMIDSTYAIMHKIGKNRLLELSNGSYYRNIVMLQPIARYIVYAEFKIKNQANYFPYIMSFYIIFDNKNNIKRIFYYPIQY